MARTALAVQQITRGGLQPDLATAANVDGNSFNNTGREVIYVINGATVCNVTVQTPGNVDGNAIADLAVAVPANEGRMIGPFAPGIYNQGGAVGDVVYVDYDDVTNVTVAVFRL